MAFVAKSTTVYLADTNAPLRISGFAGSAIEAGAPCYIDSNGKVLMAASGLVDEANHTMFDGVAISAAAINGPVTLFGLGTRIHLAESGLTIGTRLWSGSVAGTWSDAKIASADTPIAKVCSATDVRIVRSSY